MALPQAAGAVYIGGAAVGAAIVWLATPQGQRASQSLGEAMYEGGAQAVDNITSLFSSDEDEGAGATPTTTTGTQEATQECDGPHVGLFQSQGFRESQEPRRVEEAVPWDEPCHPPMKAQGNAMLSALLELTRQRSFQGAGLRAPCFDRMSRHINDSAIGVTGFHARYTIGWGITANYQVRRNTQAGPDAPRVDLEVRVGRAFGFR